MFDHDQLHDHRGDAVGEVALKLGQLDAVIAGLLFMAEMRRSEVSVLLWSNVAAAGRQ